MLHRGAPWDWLARAIPSRVLCGLGLLGLGSGGYYCLTSSRHDTGPSPFRYAPLEVLSAVLTPGMQAPRFDATEPLLHRVLTLQSASEILFPSTVSLASEKADIRARLAIYAYNVKEPHIQVERAYTPLYALARPDSRVLQLLVKRYRDGEVSRYLHRVRQGTDVSLRGPEVTWQLRDDAPLPEEIVMLVAGTGVTTAHQLLSNVFDSGAITPTTPRIAVLYAAPTMDSLQLIPELSRYQQQFPSHVSVRAFVERMPLLEHASVTSAQGEAVPASLAPRMSFTERLTSLCLGRRKQWDLVMVPSTIAVMQGRIEADDLASYLPQPYHRRLVLVCGPEGFVCAMAGPKGRDLVSQGELGGLLAKWGYQSTDVFKM